MSACFYASFAGGGAVAAGRRVQMVDQLGVPGAEVRELHRLPKFDRHPPVLLERAMLVALQGVGLRGSKVRALCRASACMCGPCMHARSTSAQTLGLVVLRWSASIMLVVVA